jgi:hypothetical protein
MLLQNVVFLILFQELWPALQQVSQYHLLLQSVNHFIGFGFITWFHDSSTQISMKIPSNFFSLRHFGLDVTTFLVGALLKAALINWCSYYDSANVFAACMLATARSIRYGSPQRLFKELVSLGKS